MAIRFSHSDVAGSCVVPVVLSNTTSNTGFSYQAEASQKYASVWASTANQNDQFTVEQFLASGTFKIALLCGTYSNGGILTINMDSVTIGTIDTYSAGTVPSVMLLSANFTNSGTRKKSFQFIIASKNGTSTGYKMQIDEIYFVRTA